MTSGPSQVSQTDVTSAVTMTRRDGPVGPPVQNEPLPHRVGRFIVVEEIGRGGMGVVYSAYDPQLDRRVAVKLVHGSLSSSTRASAGRARLLREAQAMAKLAHPNVATIFEVGTSGYSVFLAMELVSGQTMRAWFRALEPRGRWRAVVAMMRQAGKGLAAAHRVGLVHRDFKPDNVLVDVDGRARVLDFGLARTGPVDSASLPPPPSEDESSSSRPLRSDDLSAPLTEAGHLLGTPGYMAPEQLRGEPVDARSDQYSFCVSLYEGLYRERPFKGRSPKELRRQIAAGRPTPPSSSEVPAWLHALVLRGLSPEPSERFVSMDALLHALERGATRTSRWLGRGLGLAGLVLGVAGMAYGAHQADPSAAGATCEDVESRINDIWGEAQRQAIREHFAEVDASDGGTQLMARLDERASRWVEVSRLVCEATHVEHDQPESLLAVREDCLDQRLSEIRAYAAVMTRVDPDDIEGTFKGLARLRESEECRSVQSMRVELPLPPDGSVAARVMELRRHLDDVTALTASGRLDDALSLAQALEVQARDLKFLPALAEAQSRLATVYEARGNYLRASEIFEQALWSAEVGHHDAAAVDVWIKWLWVIGYRLGEHDFVEHMMPRLSAAQHRLGDDPLREVDVLRLRGMHAFTQEQYAEALAHFEAAALVLERELGLEHAKTTGMYQNVGTCLYRLGRLDESASVLLRVHQTALAVHGPNHYELASIDLSLAELALRQRDAAAAIRHYREAIAIVENTRAPSHPDRVIYYRNLGRALIADQQFEEAVSWMRRALEVEFLRGGGPAPPYSTSMSLGHALLLAGHPAAAIEHLELALTEEVQAGESKDRRRERALALFDLAKALRSAREGSGERTRELVAQARTHALALDDDLRAEIDRWLEHEPSARGR